MTRPAPDPATQCRADLGELIEYAHRVAMNVRRPHGPDAGVDESMLDPMKVMQYGRSLDRVKRGGDLAETFNSEQNDIRLVVPKHDWREWMRAYLSHETDNGWCAELNRKRL